MPFPIPTKGALDAPSVCLQVNLEWVAFVIGALEGLLIHPPYGMDRNGVYASNPAPVWDGDENAQYAADQEIQKIIAALMTGNCSEVSVLPTGSIIAFYGSVAPSGWLFCDGSTVNSDDYPALATLMGVSGDFQLPNLGGRFLLGTDGEFGSYPLGDDGGNEYDTISQVPGHSHTVRGVANDGNTPNLVGLGFVPGTGSVQYVSTIDEGWDSEVQHYSMPPYLSVPYIIKT